MPAPGTVGGRCLTQMALSGPNGLLNGRTPMKDAGSVSLYSRLKAAVPVPVKDAAKTALHLLPDLLSTAYYRPQGFRIPPRSLRRTTAGSPGVRRFIEAGRNCAAPLLEALESVGRPFGEFGAVLDFGCGCGRVFQHLYRKFPDGLHGCDVNRPAIEWMRVNFPEAEFEVNDFTPPLPYPAGRFDLVISVSVFTHIDEAQQFKWLEELNRVLSPRGIALLTVTGEHGMRKLEEQRRIGRCQRELQQDGGR